MPVMNIHLDPKNKDTLERLAGPGQRSAILRDLLDKYKSTMFGAPTGSRLRTNISISDEDKKLLEKTAKKNGLSSSELLNRMLALERAAFHKDIHQAGGPEP